MSPESHSSLSTNTHSLANTALTPLGLILLCSLFLFISSNQKNPRLWDHPHFQHPNPHKDFPNGSVVKKIHLPTQETQDWSLGQDDPTPVFLPGKFHGERNLVGYSPWGGKSWIQLFFDYKQQTFLIHSFYHSSNSSTALRSPIHWHY